jgi:hypothetical protein
MTIDALIKILEEAREMLPDGGKAQVCEPLMNVISSVHIDHKYGVVILSDYDDDGKEVKHPGPKQEVFRILTGEDEQLDEYRQQILDNLPDEEDERRDDDLPI